jgi:F-type H+-transporting ATPase subunit delta
MLGNPRLRSIEARFLAIDRRFNAIHQDFGPETVQVASDTTGATGLAGRYATALYELAEEQGALDKVADDLRTLSAMIEGSADFKRMIRSPVLSRIAQGKALTAILDRAQASELTKKFAGVLAANRRLFTLPDVITGYLSILAGRRGEVTAQVSSAQPLTPRQLADLEAQLRRIAGGKVAVEPKVDPGLLGGLVVRLGSRMIDSSLRTKLQQMRLALRA